MSLHKHDGRWRENGLSTAHVSGSYTDVNLSEQEQAKLDRFLSQYEDREERRRNWNERTRRGEKRVAG